MTSTTFFIIFIPILAIILLMVNLLLAPHNPYQEKDSVFECGFHSFLGQNRTQFSVSFFIFGLLFLLFDLEILLVYPYSVSGYNNDVYGLSIMLVFFVLLTLGFIFELGKNALTIDSRQTLAYSNTDTSKPQAFNSLRLKSGFYFNVFNIYKPYLLNIMVNIIYNTNTLFYYEKDSVFECYFHSFLVKKRTLFTVYFSFLDGILSFLDGDDSGVEGTDGGDSAGEGPDGGDPGGGPDGGDSGGEGPDGEDSDNVQNKGKGKSKAKDPTPEPTPETEENEIPYTNDMVDEQNDKDLQEAIRLSKLDKQAKDNNWVKPEGESSKYGEQREQLNKVLKEKYNQVKKEYKELVVEFNIIQGMIEENTNPEELPALLEAAQVAREKCEAKKVYMETMKEELEISSSEEESSCGDDLMEDFSSEEGSSSHHDLMEDSSSEEGSSSHDEDFSSEGSSSDHGLMEDSSSEKAIPSKRRITEESSDENPIPSKRRKTEESSDENPIPSKRRRTDESDENPIPSKRRRTEDSSDENPRPKHPRN